MFICMINLQRYMRIIYFNEKEKFLQGLSKPTISTDCKIFTRYCCNISIVTLRRFSKTFVLNQVWTRRRQVQSYKWHYLPRDKGFSTASAKKVMMNAKHHHLKSYVPKHLVTSVLIVAILKNMQFLLPPKSEGVQF